MRTIEKHARVESDTTETVINQVISILRDLDALEHQGYPITPLREIAGRLEHHLVHLRRHRLRGHKRRAARHLNHLLYHLAHFERLFYQVS